MKKNILFILCVFGAYGLNAQTVIKNYSFENWEKSGPYDVPTDWWVDTSDIRDGYVGKTSTSSAGSSAIKIGTDPSQSLGALYVDTYDSITEGIGNLTFDYIVQNNTSSFFNGALVTIYFYDVNGSYLFDTDWSSPSLTNNSSFKSGSIIIGTKTAVYYDLELSYVNANGNSNEYAIFDNLKFTKYIPASTSEITDQAPEVKCYPNPSHGFFRLSAATIPDFVTLVGVDGKTQQLRSDDYGRFSTTNLSTGIYIVRWLDEATQSAHQTKLCVSE